MNLSELFIKRPVMTGLLMIGILAFGILAYRALPVSALPNVDFPTIQVNANLPGASPETMASAVALPLEKEFSLIAGIDSMTSQSGQGTTQITIQFDLGRDIDVLVNNVGGRRVDVAAEDMPVAQWQELMDLNLTSALVCSQKLCRGMLARGWGAVINVTSIAGPIAIKGIRGRHYETAKAALAVNLVTGFILCGMRSAIVPLFVVEGLKRGASLTGIGFLGAGCIIQMGGRVTGLTFSRAGYGYTTAPSMSFSSPGPTSAVASVSITNAGAQYTSAPTVTFSAPTTPGGVRATGTAVEQRHHRDATGREAGRSKIGAVVIGIDHRALAGTDAVAREVTLGGAEQHRGPDHAVETRDVLADHVQARRPPRSEPRLVRPHADRRRVVDQRIEPDIGIVILIEGQFEQAALLLYHGLPHYLSGHHAVVVGGREQSTHECVDLVRREAHFFRQVLSQ